MITDRTKLRQLLEKATRQPWSWRLDQPPQVQLIHEPEPIMLGDFPCRVHPHNVLKCNEDGEGWPPSDVDAELIVAAVNSLPALLDEIDRRSQTAEIREQVIAERGLRLQEVDRLLEAMPPLDQVADWLDTYDRMGKVFLAAIDRSDLSSEQAENLRRAVATVEGDEVQHDLRAYVDMVRSFLDSEDSL